MPGAVGTLILPAVILKSGLYQEGGFTVLRQGYSISGEAFLTEPGAFTDVIVAAVGDATGRTPELSTTGGTSDARFIRSLCPVVEFGLVGSTMHQVDERVPVEEVRQLAGAYEAMINRYFAAFA